MSDAVSRRDYSDGVYPHKAIIKVQGSYEVVDVAQRIDAQHICITLEMRARNNLSGNTLPQAKVELHTCMADYRRAQLLAALEAQNMQETPLPEVNGGVVVRMAALANVYEEQAKQLYVAAANDLHGDDYSRWHAHREMLGQAAFDIRVVSREQGEDLESSLRNLKTAYDGDLGRCGRSLATHQTAALGAKHQMLLRVNRDIELLLSLF